MNHDPIQHEPEIPPRLAEAIRRFERLDGVDLSRLDRAVLDEAGRQLGSARARRRSGVIWRIGSAVAAAAGLALAVYVAWPGVRGPNPAVVAFDATKPVTILDAFRLARMLEPGTGGTSPKLSPTWDVTGDGAIDQRDVDAIAARAVRLDATSSTRGGAT